MIPSQHVVNQLKLSKFKSDLHYHSSSKYHNLETYLNCQTSFSNISRAI